MMAADESRIVKDPICGKEVDTLRARAVGIFGGVTYYFCSAECKAKYVDPRRAPRAESTVDSRPSTGPEQRDAARKAEGGRRKAEGPKKAEGGHKAEGETVRPSELHAAAADEEPVRYAHSRMRRITGEVSAPVVQIDLSPSAKTEPAAEEPLEPARASRAWVAIAMVMLIIAAGVIWFTLKHP